MKAKRSLVVVCLFVGILLIELTVLPGCNSDAPVAKCGAMKTAAPTTQVAQPAEQTTCPVMGGKINQNIYTQYKGQRVYFCCAGCEEKFLSSPETYVSKLPQFAR